ncbi:MAG: M3 family oligoendopeptidase [Chloroflexi bacterium]|nr:M3 family oligoendopeptidase [Chloroflexota bacterium]
MFAQLPNTIDDFQYWDWAKIEPYFKALEARDLTEAKVIDWLNDWARLTFLISETYSRLYVGTTVDTTDEATEQRYNAYMEDILQPVNVASQRLKEKLIASGLEPKGYAIELRNMRTAAELFREENVPLFTQESKFGTEYDKIIGAQTVEWEGSERTLAQMKPVYQDTDRAKRERAWTLVSQRQLADRAALNELWQRFLSLRRDIAGNADMPDYRAYHWREFMRFDYTPDDCERFHEAIEQEVVPAATRIYEKRAKRLGVGAVRPWDLDVDPLGRNPLRPFTDIDTLNSTTSTIFHKVDPQLGDYFDIMQREHLLDLDNHKGKAPGGYCTYFPVAQRPFIFMNAVGLHDDVQTLLHEGGHAFHGFEASKLPVYQQGETPIEFAEVASMSMELLSGRYLAKSEGGFYSEADAARARIEHLENDLLFWPYMAIVDAFQQWVYTHPDAAMNPDNCDAKWGELQDRFQPGIDYTGLDDAKVTGWHRKLHIFQIPFYYVDYGIAQLGAVQVWRNSLRDQAKAVADYRAALSLGGTKSLPELFKAAGAKFSMDASTLHEAVDLIESTIAQLEPA